MFRRPHAATLLVKKTVTNMGGGGNVAGTAGKLAMDEKFALGALEYVYEWNPPNDGSKRAADIARERRVAEAYDRYANILDTEFNRRTDRLVARMNEALEKCPDELLEEATLLNSEVPPHAFRMPKLSPAIPGFEPAFGFDVPQLRVAQMEERPLNRPTDQMQLNATLDALDQQDEEDRVGSVTAMSFDDEDDGGSSGSKEDGGEDGGRLQRNPYPFVDVPDVSTILRDTTAKLDELHGTMRSTVPLTGTSGEEWEAHCALQHRALARQKLILEISEDPELEEKFHSDDAFASEQLVRRGIVPLVEEEPPSEYDLKRSTKMRVLPQPLGETHYAASPKAHPFRDV